MRNEIITALRRLQVAANSSPCPPWLFASSVLKAVPKQKPAVPMRHATPNADAATPNQEAHHAAASGIKAGTTVSITPLSDLPRFVARIHVGVGPGRNAAPPGSGNRRP